MLTIWGRLNSINVQKALFCLEETGVEYRRIDAGLAFGVNRTDAYLAMNPNGLVPTLRDGDLALWESNVIIRYLAARYSAGRMWLDDPARRARADMWMDWQQTTLVAAMGTSFHGLVRSPGAFGAADVAASIARTEDLFDMLEAHLAAHGGLAGEGFTMADCAIGPTVHRWLAMPVERRARPALEQWYCALMQRPAARTVLTLPIS